MQSDWVNNALDSNLYTNWQGIHLLDGIIVILLVMKFTIQ